MKKIIITLLLISTIQVAFTQNLYEIVSGEISFFSTTPLEDIDAVNKKVKGLINIKSNELVFIATIVGFHFKKPLMQEHFNENYMESDKYPTAKFKGKINEEIDFTKDGEYEVTVKGILNLHGVDQERIIKGKVIIKNGKIQIIAAFDVQLEDHKIDIPKVVTAKIAETVEVKVNANFEKKK